MRKDEEGISKLEMKEQNHKKFNRFEQIRIKNSKKKKGKKQNQ